MRPVYPAAPGAPGLFALSDEGARRGFAAGAGLTPEAVFDVESPFVYSDRATALRGLKSAGVSAAVIDARGEAAVEAAYSAALAPFRRPDGTFRAGATFRCLLARS